MKPTLLAVGFGVVALLSAMRAEAWAELNYSQFTPYADRTILLQCDANYAAPCAQGHGVADSYVQPWNPLDGSRWSYYRAVFEGHVIYLDMYDTRQACPVGWGWDRGYHWLVYATGTDGVTLGPYDICTAHGGDGKEYLRMHNQFNANPGNYSIDFRREGPWKGPAVVFEFDQMKHKLMPFVIP